LLAESYLLYMSITQTSTWN